MESIKNKIEIISMTLVIAVILSAVLFINSKFYVENNIVADSGEIVWLIYLIKFYVAFSVIGLTANLVLMHIRYTKLKGFHEG